MAPPAGPKTAAAPTVSRVAFVYNDRVSATLPLAKRLADLTRSSGRDTRIVSTWDQRLKANLDGVQLAVTFGGDGTILRTARAGAPSGVPILGVNFGRIGFLTELAPDEAEQRLPDYLEGRCWIEERDMLGLSLGDLSSSAARLDGQQLATEYQALNDIILGRAERARVVSLDLAVDDAHLATLRADGIVIASATGSTAYSLSAGGPVIHPYVGGILINPILPHLSFLHSLVVPITSKIVVRIESDHGAMCSVDGQIDIRLDGHAVVTVQVAPFPCHFLRTGPVSSFFRTLLDRLHT